MSRRRADRPVQLAALAADCASRLAAALRQSGLDAGAGEEIAPLAYYFRRAIVAVEALRDAALVREGPSVLDDEEIES